MDLESYKWEKVTDSVDPLVQKLVKSKKVKDKCQHNSAPTLNVHGRLQNLKHNLLCHKVQCRQK